MSYIPIANEDAIFLQSPIRRHPERQRRISCHDRGLRSFADAQDDGGRRLKSRILKPFRHICFISALLLCSSMSVGYASTHKPAESLAQASASDSPGESIYQQYCVLCHAPEPQIPLGAPRLGMPADWQQRDLNDSAALFKRMDEGMGAMPPRGGCFECSDELLQAAIDYLLLNSQAGN